MSNAHLAVAMAALPEPPNDSRPPHWDYWRHDLWARAQQQPPDSFWDWPAVRHTMLVEHFPIGAQLAHLQTDWPRWEAALSHLGNEKHARNMINQAYHVKLWEDTTGRRIEQLRTIYEFGGGYGALAHLARRMGFTGRYLIYDLPEFALLQQWFLAGQGVPVEHVDGPEHSDLFVALYSLSETPDEVRRYWGLRAAAGSYLLLYSGQWAEHDNRDWAYGFMQERWQKRWRTKQFPGRPDYYSFGS